MKYIKEETKFIGKYSNTVFQTILMSIQPYKFKFLFSICLGFLGRTLLLSNTNIIGKWADSLCSGSIYCKEKSGIFKNFSNSDFFILLFIFSFLGLIFLMAFRISIARLGTYSVARLYDETTFRVSRFPMSFFDTNPIGRIITRFSSDYNAVFRMAGGPLGEFLSISFDVMLFFILIVVASSYYIPLVLFSIFINYVIYKLNQAHLRKLRREHSLSRSPVIAHFAETAQGSKVIRAYGKQKIFTNHFMHKLEHYISKKNRINMKISLFSLQMSFVNIFILFLTALVGIWLIKNNYVTVGSLGVAFTFIAMTSSTIQIFFEWISSIEDALTGTERMAEYLYKEIEPGALLPSNTNFSTGHPIMSSENSANPHDTTTMTAIEVSHLSLRYQQNLPLALDQISFQVKQGEKIGIIGKTGSGKSTLIQALFHLYPFESGKLIINGFEANLNNMTSESHFIPLETFRKGIFLLTQDPILYVGSLRENFTLNEKIPDDKIISIAKMVGLENLILSQPNSLNMIVEEKGANLSSGEKQLICMARCLLQDSPIILMDEATSSVDPETEELLVTSTKHFLKDKTQIIVAHRLSTIEDCNKIIWLHAGKIVLNDKPEVVLPVFKKFDKFNQ